MNSRIQKLIDRTIAGEMWVRPVPTKYDRKDLFLSPVKMSGKRVCEYIANQDFLILEESCFTGLMRFDSSVEGDIFNRHGHKNFQIALDNFYNKPLDNLITFEWQHSVGDFAKIMRRGLVGIKEDIEASLQAHQGDQVAIEFLETQMDVCNAMIQRAKKGAKLVAEKANQVENAEYRANLLQLSAGLSKVPEYPAESFYEAVLCLYFCYSFIPDSIGLIDRYLYAYYKKDIDRGVLTRERAKEYLQELYLMLQARIHISSDRFYRGGESHFCIGGFLANGEDGFNDLSKLALEALMELPTWIPQISVRWTPKTPAEVWKFVLDCERKDPNKRIAFVNDVPRLKGLVEYAKIPYEDAVNYTMMGCNELALPGGIVFGFEMMNVVRSIENTFYHCTEEVLRAKTFDEFYAIYHRELLHDLDEWDLFAKGFQDIRSRDCNLVSNIFMEGCIEHAKSITQGGASRFIAVNQLIGISNVIDSLAVTKQFVYDEKLITMQELVDALRNDWNGYEEIRNLILKKGHFFGNDDECSNLVARKFMESLEIWNTGDNFLGKKTMFGNLIGYNEHNKFFGEALKATPDGRKAGEMINFGIGQFQCRDRSGLTALLNSVAKCDPAAVLTGPSVTNILVDEKLIMEDANFEKMADLLETYFQNGGTHFQLNYVSKEDLINAKVKPEEYKNLRVRVSGFSDYFNNLNDALQDEIIERTTHVK